MKSHAAWHLKIQHVLTEDEARCWNELLVQQDQPTPFMRHAYLEAMQESGSAVPESGWQPLWFVLEQAGWRGWAGACVVYLKAHSYGEYVFDWAWAEAHERHGLSYYPKALIAVPFTPVPGARLLAVSDDARAALLRGVIQWCKSQDISSLHILFGSPADLNAARELGLSIRDSVQFHWKNPQALLGDAEASALGLSQQSLSCMTWAEFLAQLHRDKRKKIQQEQRRVEAAGVRYRIRRGAEISAHDWDFFYRCYSQTYWEHGNAPYLTRAFFECMQSRMPEAWLMFIAECNGEPIACSLLGLHENGRGDVEAAYGRYWGAIERVHGLHFDACYYQPIAWCLKHGVARFEGGAQGEHKMARTLMPTLTQSAHWLHHKGFAQAVASVISHEKKQVRDYLEALEARTPFKIDSEYGVADE